MTSPGYATAKLGPVSLTKAFNLSDGVGGPINIFDSFHGAALGKVTASWNGREVLRVRVKADRAHEAAIATIVRARHLTLE